LAIATSFLPKKQVKSTLSLMGTSNAFLCHRRLPFSRHPRLLQAPILLRRFENLELALAHWLTCSLSQLKQVLSRESY